MARPKRSSGGGRRGHPARGRVAEARHGNLRCRPLTATPVGVPPFVAHIATSFDSDRNGLRSCRLPATGGGAGRPWATHVESRPLRVEGRIIEASARLSRDRAHLLVVASTPTLRLRDPPSLGEEALPAPPVGSFDPTGATAFGAAVTYLRAAFRPFVAFLCPARPWTSLPWSAHVPRGACAATFASRRFRRAACLICNARGVAPRDCREREARGVGRTSLPSDCADLSAFAAPRGYLPCGRYRCGALSSVADARIGLRRPALRRARLEGAPAAFGCQRRLAKSRRLSSGHPRQSSTSRRERVFKSFP